MPRVSRAFILAALLWLLSAMAVAAGAAGRGRAALLDPTVLHLLVVGWLTQMVFGVAYWLFPRFSANAPRGSASLGWLTFVTLNTGLILRALAEPGAIGGRAVMLTASAALQLLATLGFVANTWPRIRERP